MTEKWQGSPEDRERTRVEAPEASWALRAVNRASTEVDHALAHRLGLRPLDYAALGHVMDSTHPLGPADLSTALGISTGSATELVDRLERDGHLQRRPHPSDRRRVVLQATDDATARLIGALGPLFAELDALAAALPPEDRPVVVRFLRDAAERMERWARSPQAPQDGHR